MAVNDVIAIRFFFTAGLQEGIVGLNYLSTGVVGTAPPGNFIAAQFETAFAPLFIALLSANAAYIRTDAQRVRPLPPTAPAESGVLLSVGSVAGDMLPTQTAGLITKRTALAGRAYRGRAYIPFPGEADNAAMSTPTAGYVTRLISLAAQMIVPVIVTNAGNAETWTPVIWHKLTALTTVIVDGVARTEWATQRRRAQID